MQNRFTSVQNLSGQSLHLLNSTSITIMSRHKIGSQKHLMKAQSNPKLKAKCKRLFGLTRVHQGCLTLSRNRSIGSPLRQWSQLYFSVFSLFESQSQSLARKCGPCANNAPNPTTR